MPRKKKVEQKPINDYEAFLLNKIEKCQRIVSELKENEIWGQIREDYEATSKSLDLAWAYEDVLSPRFKQMQAAKMAATTFMNLVANYEHDLKLAQTELEKFRQPDKVIKKDFDEEGVETSSESTLQETAYHGR